MIDPNLINLLVCPKSLSTLIYMNNSDELGCIESKLAYPIHDGIPVMLVAESRELSTDEIKSLSSAADA